MLAQGLQFTRTMIPVVIPPSGIASPVYYTIKATKKNKDKRKPKPEISAQTHTLKKEKSKRVIETYRNENGKESLSVKETISYSSQSDTLDELQINPSLCCTLSEISDHKNIKKEKRAKPKQDFHKVITSESFEALATEFLNTSGDTKIKIHLMNETEKHLLSENIRVPVLNAIRECILEVNSQRHNETTTVQKFVRCNNQKLDNIFDKLTCIEEKLNSIHTDYNSKAKAIAQEVHDDNMRSESAVKPKSPQVKAQKAADHVSTLERLGEDLLELIEDNSMAGLERPDSSGDEYYRPTLSARKKFRGKSAVVHLEAGNKDLAEVLGGGEDTNVFKPSSSQNSQLVRPEAAGRIPARFCWTDAARKNAVT
ncbi:hypothetical protein O0L34_g7943 [Tuta absoluta]|nr:hypothetical protein O0L34_g7943 [Tuta absoluta]